MTLPKKTSCVWDTWSAFFETSVRHWSQVFEGRKFSGTNLKDLLSFRGNCDKSKSSVGKENATCLKVGDGIDVNVDDDVNGVKNFEITARDGSWSKLCPTFQWGKMISFWSFLKCWAADGDWKAQNVFFCEKGWNKKTYWRFQLKKTMQVSNLQLDCLNGVPYS